MEATHTATPWAERNERVFDSAGNVIASVWPVGGEVDETQLPNESWLDMRERTKDARQQKQAETKANALFIVRACNAHDDLVKALILARANINPLDVAPGTFYQIDAALTKAGA